MSDSKGVLIAFEGIDGSGKSTQWKRICRWLDEEGYDIEMSFEPTNRTHGQALRDAWATGDRLPVEEEIALFDADRKQHVNEIIRPALNRGAIVLLDRYYYSSAVYQGTREGQTPNNILRHYEGFCPRADLMLLYDLFVDVALERMRHTRSNLDAMEQAENLKLVRHTYMRLDCPEIKIVDASRSSDEVWERTRSVVEAFIENRGNR
jgi:dTMP kinase